MAAEKKDTKVEKTVKAKPAKKAAAVETVVELRAELSKIQIDIIAGKEKNTSKLKVIRKKIARLLTKENEQK